MNFNSGNVNPANNNNRRYGFTARAVQHLPGATHNNKNNNVRTPQMKHYKRTIWQ